MIGGRQADTPPNYKRLPLLIDNTNEQVLVVLKY